jgi:cytochrome b561
LQLAETENSSRYDKATILFHWATAVLVFGQWFGAQTIDWFPRGPLRVDARSVHIVVGVLLTALLVARIVWRLSAGRRLPTEGPSPAVAFLAKSVHRLLYLLLLAMVLVGLALTWARGDSLFNLFSIPAFDPGNKALAHRIFDIHNFLGWAILGLAGLHAGAALVHRYVWKDGVLARMSLRR